MEPPTPTSPGWYRDPEEPVRLQHWNGRSWDQRRRAVPAWAVESKAYVTVETSRREGDPTLDGPVHPARLLAIAAATGTSTPSRPRSTSPGRLVRTVGGSGRGPALPSWSTGTRPVRRTAWSKPRTALLTVSALIGLAVLILTATVGIAPHPYTATTLTADRTFTSSANLACGEAMGAIRLLSPPAMSAAGTSTTASPSTVATANANLARLGTKIRDLPVIDGARSSILGWLDYWNQFATDRQREAGLAARAASAASPTGTSSAADALASTVSLDADHADAFATTNGLGNCTLAGTPSAVTAS